LDEDLHGKLTILRNRLQALQSRRALVRWASALSAVAAMMIGLWGIAFLFDWSLRLSLGWRFAVLCGWTAGVVWAIQKFAWPALAARESLDDIALIVERRHQIDSDLIGALQFESAEAARWGSPRLSAAVIDYVADFSPDLDVFQGLSYEPLPRRLAALLLLLVGMAAIVGLFPATAGAFWNRFWLGSARYPSRTVISQLVVNGEQAPVFHPEQPVTLSLPQGTPLTIEAVCEGDIPELGSARLQNRADRAETRFELKPLADRGDAVFTAEHPLPSDDADLQVFLGDTWSDPVTICIVPLPLIDVAWQVKPPGYAAAAEENSAGGAARYLSVLEGSALNLAVRATNKPLKKVELHRGEEVVPLAARGSGLDAVWSLPPGSSLSAIMDGFGYEIHAEDHDGLKLTPPIAGSVRIKPDRPPRVASAMVTKLVIPTARPRLAFGAVDDYGLQQIRLRIDVTHENGETESHAEVLRDVPADAPPLSVRDEIRLDLASYKLEKGDELRLTVEAADNRGEFESRVGAGEPLILKVTDRSGILAGLNESDQVSVKQLDAIIQRELGIGGDKR
jgi:hypothetical protein